MKQQEDYKQDLYKMHLIRFFEIEAGNFYKKGLVKGGIHASIGQEAVEVGVISQLNRRDLITSTHRGHGHHIAKGADTKKLMAEILGKSTGYCRGRGGSMHVSAFDIGSLGAFPIVGSGTPIGVGAALTQKVRGTDSIVVSFFGEGALGQGTVYEAMNLAAIWKLPILFVCENNQYAVSTNRTNASAIKDIGNMAVSHGIAAQNINGQKLPEVKRAAAKAVQKIRSESAPYFIHAQTYRFEGHYVGEPEVYRTREEVKEKRETMDPIKIFTAFLLKKGILEEEKIEGIKREAKEEIKAACQYALNSQAPQPEEVGEYVYA